MNKLPPSKLLEYNMIEPYDVSALKLNLGSYKTVPPVRPTNFLDEFRADPSSIFFGQELEFSKQLKKLYYTMTPSQIVDAQELVPLLVFSIFAIFLAIVILGASFFFAIQKPDTEKLSIYECGFDPYEDSRNKFDIRFYIIAILFIIFDLETIFCFPWIMSLGLSDSLAFWAMMDFLLELIVGFVYVWCAGALVWE